MIIHFFAAQFRHNDRINFRRRSFTTFQQFAGIFTLAIGATKIFAKTTGFELHFAAAFITLKRWAFVAFQTISALLYFITGTIRIVTADMKFAMLIKQVGIHG